MRGKLESLPDSYTTATSYENINFFPKQQFLQESVEIVKYLQVKSYYSASICGSNWGVAIQNYIIAREKKNNIKRPFFFFLFMGGGQMRSNYSIKSQNSQTVSQSKIQSIKCKLKWIHSHYKTAVNNINWAINRGQNLVAF